MAFDTEHENKPPVIIIGAARSGTNILRDCLTGLPGLGTWPCDEINAIWRHGNRAHPTDELTPEMASPAVKGFIRKRFSRIRQVYKLNRVVEKTCANSLRVLFVQRIFPEAQYIFLIRDGRDAVLSAVRRWTASFDLLYTLRKARFVPLSDIPFYFLGYVRNRIHQVYSKEKRLSSWGPRFQGLQEALQGRGLAEVCAMQWVQCVQKAEHDFQHIHPKRIYRLYYEDFVSSPKAHLRGMCRFLGLPEQHVEGVSKLSSISTGSIGRWKSAPMGEIDMIQPLIQETLQRHGYF